MVAASSSSPVNEASLLDPALHSPAVLEMLSLNMSRTVIEYAVDCIIETVDYAMGRPSSSRGRSSSRHTSHANFLAFVNNVLHKAEVKLPVLLVALVYIDRAKPHLQIALEQWACERVFLGALILANKYCNDSTLKNVHWALCTGVFGKRDVGRIEREFLDVLDYELGVHESDLLSHHDAIISLFHPMRFHTRSHHTVSAPASPMHPSVKLTPVSNSLPSRWSSSSSQESAEDSDDLHSSPSSSSMSPMPVTPGMDVEPAYVVPANSKPLPMHAHPEVLLPSQHQPHPVMLSVPKSHTHSSNHSHHRLSSALQMLKSLPIPHFHNSSQQHSSSSSSSAEPSPLSAVSSASSFSAPQPPQRCRPTSAAPASHLRPAQVVM